MAEKTTEERIQEAKNRQSVLAPPTVTSPPSQQLTLNQAQDASVQIRVDQPSSYENTGRTRDMTEDTNNTLQLQKIQSTTIDTTVTPTDSFSAQENIQNLIPQTNVSPKASLDAQRALQRLQSNCNHIYSSVTNRCTLCNKSRSSHVYDV